MKIRFWLWPCVGLLAALLSFGVPVAAGEADSPPRMANGAVIEGAVLEATPDGLVIQGARGRYTAPWKYLSAGTRHRYEIPMLIAQEVARSNALKKAQAEAAKKAAAAKAAAEKAAAKAAATNAVAKAAATNAAAKAAAPAGVATNAAAADAAGVDTNAPPAAK